MKGVKNHVSFLISLMAVVFVIDLTHQMSASKLLPISDSRLCPGDVVTYKCTVVSQYSGAGGITIWKGSAFDDHCQESGQEIRLRHSHYDSPEGTHQSCRDGTLEGRIVGVENNHYTSHLIVNQKCNFIGKGVECVYDDGVREELIGFLNITVAPFPPPDRVFVSYVDVGSRQIDFKWSKVFPLCPAIHYNVSTSNCGICPTETTQTTATCSNIPTDGSLCTFVVKTVVCGKIAGNFSDTVEVMLKGLDCHESIASACLLAVVVIILCIIVVVMLFLTKEKLKRKLKKLKVTRRITQESTYEDVRKHQEIIDVGLTKNAAYAQPSDL